MTAADPVMRLQASLDRVVHWVEAHDYKAYEPADGNSSILFPLTGGRVWPMRALQQIVLRSPINIRPLLGVARHESAIGRGYMAAGYLAMHRLAGTSASRQKAEACLQWLIDHRAEDDPDFCWGDPYEYATRSGRRRRGAPILIWTSLIGQFFLDAYNDFGEGRYLAVAQSVGRWTSRLPVEVTDSGSCLSYYAYAQASIHNANAMGAAFLARLGGLTDDRSLIKLARTTMAYTCHRQLPDGGWWYGEAAKYHWIDNFHTGYNLSALKTYRDATRDRTFDAHFFRGLEYFKRQFFESDGRPKYFHDRTYPVDIQCAAQAIETLTAVADEDPEALPLAAKVAEWTISHLQASDGHFDYRHLGWTVVTTPMLHWGQGTMTKALAALLLRLGRSSAHTRPDIAAGPIHRRELATTSFP